VERELVTLTAADGEVHDALLHVDTRAARVHERRTGRRTAILHVHGIMGNFLVGTLRFVPAPLARGGYPTLVLETRMGNVGQLFGRAIFEDALADLDAAVDWLREHGHDHIVLSGYSSGAALAIRFAAARRPEHLRGVVCFGAPWGLPESMRARADHFESEPSYEDLAATVRESIGEDPAAAHPDRLFVIERSRGPTRRPADSEVYTWRTWWHSRGPEALAAMTHRQIGDVGAPILLVQGADDPVVDPGEAEALAAVAREAGNDDVEVALIPGTGHTFQGAEIATTAAALRWLADRA
jgi:pimeloyl-ACP methyl ester carboxylesterase